MWFLLPASIRDDNMYFHCYLNITTTLHGPMTGVFGTQTCVLPTYLCCHYASFYPLHHTTTPLFERRLDSGQVVVGWTGTWRFAPPLPHHFGFNWACPIPLLPSLHPATPPVSPDNSGGCAFLVGSLPFPPSQHPHPPPLC